MPSAGLHHWEVELEYQLQSQETTKNTFYKKTIEVFLMSWSCVVLPSLETPTFIISLITLQTSILMPLSPLLSRSRWNIFSLSSYTWLPMIILIILWFHCIRQRNDQAQMHHNFDKSQKCLLLCFQYPTRWYFMAAAVTVYHDSQVFNPIITKRVRIQQI